MQGKDITLQGAVVVADGDAAGVQVLNAIPWHSIADEQQILLQLGTTFDGLSAEKAAKRLQQCVLAVPAGVVTPVSIHLWKAYSHTTLWQPGYATQSHTVINIVPVPITAPVASSCGM